jgi:hypothetical protein
MNNFENLPSEVQILIENFGDETGYDKLEELKEQVEEHGYTFEYGLDGIITDFYTLCSCCKKEINEDRDPVYFTQSGEVYCEGCESDAWQYANTVIVCKDGENRKYIWCQEFGFRDTEWWEEASPNGVERFNYVRTDGWRGYWDTIVEDGYTTLASGWSTGRWSDVPWKHKFNDFVDSIADGEVECPFELIFSFGLTSNVFSTSSDVIIRESKLEAFTEWLAEEMGTTLEEIRHSLV